jgi:hypothetical protein
MQTRWELGSELDWSNGLLMSFASKNLLPEKYELFSTASAALLSLGTLLNKNEGRRLRIHIPSFFCMDVVAKLSNVVDIFWYHDLPTQMSPDFSTLKTSPGDLILAVNLFGVRDGKVWQEWLNENKEAILIEDHSHDPFSPWAQQSTAHYAITSLRKTLPIPDGGIIYSPQNLELPRSTGIKSIGAYKRLTSMLLKRAFLSGIDISKDVYRQMDVKSQECFDKHELSDISELTANAVSDFTASILNHLNIPQFRRQREANIQHFVNLSLTGENLLWRHLVKSWPPGGVPLNVILLCQTQEIRDALNEHLISQNIFSSIHWLQPRKGISSNDPVAIDISSRILTIPSDQRYSIDDITHVAGIISNFFDRIEKQIFTHKQ